MNGPMSTGASGRLRLVEVRDRSAFNDAGLKVETDLQVPLTTLGRWVFHAPHDACWSTPHPHLHDYPHTFLGVRGRCRLAYGQQGAEPERTVLAAGEVQPVPAGVAHQILLEPGAVVASYIPHLTWLRRPEVVTVTEEEWLSCG